jgi:hypothetical protein
MKTRKLYLPACGFFLITILACNIGAQTNGPVTAATMALETFTALTAEAAASQAAVTPTETFTPAPAPTDTTIPSPAATAQNPLVIRDALCWLGPGSVYEVSSAIHAGTRVTLLGRGSIPGWWIVNDPIYHDPCWIHQQDLQIDSNYDLSNLQIFNPPPTPTPTFTMTPAITPSPTP